MTKRALLTGGTGFVGANLARTLLHQGHEVYLLARPGYKPWRIAGILKDLHMIEVDLRNRDGLDQVVDKILPEWVFHLASYGAYPFQTDSGLMVQTNLTGTINLVDVCLKTGFESFIYAGTSSEYGFKDHAPLETELVEPNSSYAVTKAAATHFCSYTARSTGMRLYTLRLYSVYGPFEEPSRLIPSLIIHGLEGRLPPLVTPHIGRDFVYVGDVCQAFLLVAAQPNQEAGAVYNVGSGIQVTIEKAVEIARRLMNIPTEPDWGSMQERSWDTSVWVSNPEKIYAKTGWTAGTSLEGGFQETVSWFCQNPSYIDFYKKTNLNKSVG